jgi:hypothetical protein
VHLVHLLAAITDLIPPSGLAAGTGLGAALALTGWVVRMEKDLLASFRERNAELERENEELRAARARQEKSLTDWRYRYLRLSAMTGQRVALTADDEEAETGT